MSLTPTKNPGEALLAATLVTPRDPERAKRALARAAAHEARPITWKLNKAQQDEVLRAYMDGGSEVEIAEKYGVGQNYARVLARRCGLSRQRMRQDVAYPELLERIKANSMLIEQAMREVRRDMDKLEAVPGQALDDGGGESRVTISKLQRRLPIPFATSGCSAGCW